MKNIFYMTVFLVLAECQIKDKDAPSPSESYIKYFGAANTSYEMVDMEIIYDVSDSSIVNSIIMLGTRENDDALRDIYLMKTDANGVFMADTAYSYDGNSDDVASQLSRAGENILVVGNTTSSIESGSLRGIVWNEFTTDLVPFNTDETLFSIFTNPASPTQISANDLIQTSDGNLVMVGSYMPQGGGQKYFRMKINASQKGNISYPSSNSNSDAALEWFVSGGAGNVSNLVKVFEESSGNLVFVGNSSFPDSDGNIGVNVILINATSSGITSNSSSYGFNLSENTRSEFDVMTDAIPKQGGYAIVGTSTIGNTSRAFYIDSATPNLRRLLPSIYTLNGVSTKTNAMGITQGPKNDFVVVGQYPDFRIDTQDGQQDKAAEVMIYRTDQIGAPLEEYEINYGLINGDDRAVVAKTLPDGKILIGATIDFGDTFMSLIKLNDTGLLDN